MYKHCKEHGGRTDGAVECPDCEIELNEELAFPQELSDREVVQTAVPGAFLGWGHPSARPGELGPKKYQILYDPGPNARAYEALCDFEDSEEDAWKSARQHRIVQAFEAHSAFEASAR